MTRTPDSTRLVRVTGTVADLALAAAWMEGLVAHLPADQRVRFLKHLPPITGYTMWALTSWGEA